MLYLWYFPVICICIVLLHDTNIPVHSYWEPRNDLCVYSTKFYKDANHQLWTSNSLLLKVRNLSSCNLNHTHEIMEANSNSCVLFLNVVCVYSGFTVQATVFQQLLNLFLQRGSVIRKSPWAVSHFSFSYFEPNTVKHTNTDQKIKWGDTA